MSAPTKRNTPIAFEMDLKYPFTTAAGEEITKITARRGTRADLRASAQYSNIDFEQESFLFARLTGLTIEDLDLLDMEDNAEMVGRFRELLKSKREI